MAKHHVYVITPFHHHRSSLHYNSHLTSFPSKQEQMKENLHRQFSSRKLNVRLKEVLHAQRPRTQTHSVSQIELPRTVWWALSFKRRVKFQRTAWAGRTVCCHRKAETLLPLSGPHHILCISTHMLSPIYFVRALEACQIPWWANSVHYLGKKIIQQKLKHKITPT